MLIVDESIEAEGKIARVGGNENRSSRLSKGNVTPFDAIANAAMAVEFEQTETGRKDDFIEWLLT